VVLHIDLGPSIYGWDDAIVRSTDKGGESGEKEVCVPLAEPVDRGEHGAHCL
jgi:hypothetical protein